MACSYAYKLWGQPLDSDLDLGLSGEPLGSLSHDAIRIVRDRQYRLRDLDERESLECPNHDGSIWLTISRSGTAYLLDFTGLCTFRINPDNRLIEYAPEPGTGTSTIVHLLLDHALPRLISLLPNYFVLHASAWIVKNVAVIALGQSGAGKSTLASRFGAEGFPILTDDCLVLHQNPQSGEWVALPSYPSVRLWPDSIEAVGVDTSALREVAHYSSKRRTAAEQDNLRFATEPVPLGGAFVLNSSESVECSVHPGSVNEAFGALGSGVFRLEIASPEMNRREFEILTDIVEKIPFWSVSHGNDYTQLPELQQRILAVLR